MQSQREMEADDERRRVRLKKRRRAVASGSAREEVDPRTEDVYTSIPAYATFKFDPEAWFSVLTDYGVDETAKQELFALAQVEPDGHTRALKVITKLLKKHSDSESLRNPSAFVHGCCKTEFEAALW